MALGFDIWKLVLNGYVAPSSPPMDLVAKKESEINAKSMNENLCGLLKSDCVKVMHCVSMKDIWEKLQKTHEGDKNIKKCNLKTHNRLFNRLKMKEKEKMAAYLLHVQKMLLTQLEVLEKRLRMK